MSFRRWVTPQINAVACPALGIEPKPTEEGRSSAAGWAALNFCAERVA